MDLNNEARRELRNALKASLTRDQLAEILDYGCKRNLGDMTAPNDVDPTAFRKVVNEANGKGWAHELIAAALDFAPGSPTLQVFAQSHMRSVTRDTMDGLEAIVKARQHPVDLMPWLGRMGEVQRQICRIEVPQGPKTMFGTGFLVGPDIVLTNHHVIRPLLDDGVDAESVCLLFDYLLDADGVQIRDITSANLEMQNWHIASSPHSNVDLATHSGQELPKSNELDYALIRLSEKLGVLPVAGKDASDDAAIRGWISIKKSTCEPKKGDGVIVLQHPNGEPLKMTFGDLLEVNGNGTRARYDANTEGGSSGSPVFDMDWQLMALHHAGDPGYAELHRANFNQGIPIGLIANDVSDNVNFEAQNV